MVVELSVTQGSNLGRFWTLLDALFKLPFVKVHGNLTWLRILVCLAVSANSIVSLIQSPPSPALGNLQFLVSTWEAAAAAWSESFMEIALDPKHNGNVINATSIACCPILCCPCFAPLIVQY